MRRETLFRIGSALMMGVVMGSCTEDTPDRDISQFNRPQDVALVCYDDVRGPLPIRFCEAAERTDEQLYAFVTQTEYGEVAVVNLENYRVRDQEGRIPFNSYVPVGGQPADIVASHDGRRVYTVNAETRDISVIDVQERIRRPSMTPVDSIPIGFPGVRIVMASDAGTGSGGESIANRFAFVSQPDAGRLALVNLVSYMVEVDGEEQRIPAGELAYLRLDAGTLSSESITDDRPGGIAPMAMEVSSRYGTLYVGGRNRLVENDTSTGNYIVEIHMAAFVERSRQAFEQTGEVVALDPGDVVIRRMDLGEFTSRDLSIEPDLERWLYVVENERGGVVVLDLLTGLLLPVNEWNEAADNPYSISFPGLARRVKLVRYSERLAEDAVPDPFTFNGTFGIVATTQASIFVVDVAVDERFSGQMPDYSFYPHSLRSKTPWYTTSRSGDTAPEPLLPELAAAPTLVLGEDRISLFQSPFLPMATSQEEEENSCDDIADGFREGPEDGSWNVWFRCDRRMATSESWYLVYQGFLGISGVGIFVGSDDGETVFVDEYKDFCAAGLLGPAGADLWGADDGERDLSAYAGFVEYPGDLVELTSGPSPLHPETDCSAFEGEGVRLVYQVTGIVDSSTLRIQALESETVSYAPVPTRECFGQAFSYRIRARESWVLSGSASGRWHSGSMENDSCVPWPQDEQGTFITSRVFETVPYENRFFRFTLGPVEELDTDRREDALAASSIVWTTINGFAPMSATLGADITDIDIAPDGNIVLVDQSRQQMLLFDMVNKFAPVTKPIN